jgi:hypothetical protein
MKKKLLIASAIFITSISQAATITVLNTSDSGAGSLRDAIGNSFNGDTIRFDPSIINSGNDTITLASEIAFSKSLTIIGLTNITDTLFISGDNNSRIFGITNTTNVTLDSLALINGNGQGATASGNGGAISFTNSGSLFINNTIIKNNSIITPAFGSIGYGGGIHSPSSPIIVTNSTFSGNIASVGDSGLGYGGGIYTNSSPVTVTNSTFIGNTASAGDGGLGYGGGIYAQTNSITVTNSTFSGNTASAGDGGLGYGGGVYTRTNSITVTNSTFNENTTSTGNGGIALGGGAYTSTASSSISIGSSIFDGSNISNQGANSITSQGYNIFSDAPTGATMTGDVTGATASLQSLAFNGGTTQTMLPGAGSIAINMGNPNDLSDAQNRTISGGRRDVGAAETACITDPGTYTETVCFGGSIVFNGTTYDANNLTGSEVFTAGDNNCDSIVAVTLTIENAIDNTTTTNGLTLTANASGGATYDWIDCATSNSIIPAETNAAFTATENGDYAVVVTVGNCSDTSDCINVSTVGIEEQTSNINLSIHPNPVTNTLTIKNKELKINNISILNVSGGIVKTINESTNIIDVSNLAKGIYFLQIHTDNGVLSKKFIKE